MNLAPLSVQHLVKKYGSFTAVDQVSFDVKPGEVFGLLGPNGAGKTSIISIVTTLEKPNQGQVQVFGHDVVTESRKTKQMVGVVHQEVINSGFFDVQEILEFQAGFYGRRQTKEKIEYLLHKLGLYQHRNKKVKQLSGGMKRRLMIAKALVHGPQLLLLDEPTAGVDIELRENLWNFVRELKSQGLSILLTTHYLEEAEELCDRVGIINLGRVEFLGATRDVIKQFTQKKIFLILTEERKIESPFLNSSKGREYCFYVPSEKPVGELLDQLKISSSMIVDIRIEEGDLEEAFRRVLKTREVQT